MKNYTDTKNKIIGKLLRSPLESKSLNQISKETNLSYVTVHKIIPGLIKRKIIKLEKKGRSNLISIDFCNVSIDRLSSAILYEGNNFLKKKPKIVLFLKEIKEDLYDMFYSLVIFGSYAKQKHTKNSDLDLLFIIPYRKDTEKYKERLNKISRLHTAFKKDINIVCVEDFMKMLEKRNSVGRSAFQHGIVVFGTEQYYAMVKQYVREKGY